MTHHPKNITREVIVVAFVVVSFFAGTFFGFANRSFADKISGVIGKEPPTSVTGESIDFNSFWKTWNLLNEKFPGAESISNEQRVYGAIEGLVASFDDPYTVFFPPVENKNFQESISGEFGGVGMEVEIKDDVLTVVSPLNGTPAFKAGIKPGDRIIKINDILTDTLTLDEAVTAIRGKEGTTVRVTLFREGESKPLEISMVRAIISIPTIKTELTQDKIFVISLYNFSENSGPEFKKAMVEFKASKSNKLVVDLRGNPGGYLNSSIEISSQFLPEGTLIVSEDFGKGAELFSHRSRGYNIVGKDTKVVVLINGGSASASEIVAGALQDNGIATIVGEQSYGKGSVQEVVKITESTSLKVTIAKWLTPKGNSISEKGITPDVVVVPTPEDLKAKKDVQLLKAYELLLK